MPDTRSVVKKMIAAGESEEDIAAVIKRLNSGSEVKSGLPDMSPEIKTPDKDEYRGPDTFWGGVKKSLFGDEFNETAKKSLKGFAKGTADIPATFADTAQGLGAGIISLTDDPKAHFRAMGPAFQEMGRGIRDVTMNAGADPEAFGHLSGQLFGQPAFTEGLIKTPAIAKATTGAINRIPAVNKTFSSVGKALEGTRNPVIPQTPRGLVAGAVRGVARPVGRALSRVGERGRLDAGTRPPSPKTNIKLKGETETPHSPDSDIFAGGGEGAVRPRPVRRDSTRVDQNTEFTRPVTETAEQLAARKRPSVFTGGQSRRNQSTQFEPRPADTTPYPVPGEIPPGIPGEAPLVRDTTPYERPPVKPEGLPPEPPPIDPFAAPASKIPLKGGRLKPNRRNQSPPYEPSIDPFAPPTTSSIGVGEGGLSSRYRHRPYEPGQEAEALAKPKPKAAPAPPKFEPSVDPATNLSPEDIALMQSRRAELKAALEKMAGGEMVDTTTGEITTPPRTKGPWRQSEPDVNPNEFDIGPDETDLEFGPNDPSIANDAGRQFADEVERTFPGDEAYDLGEVSPGFRQTSSMPDWGEAPPRTIRPEEWGDWGPDADIPTLVPDASGSHVAAPKSRFDPFDSPEASQDRIDYPNRSILDDSPEASQDRIDSAARAKVRPGVNPLRPEVPPGQVTNRSMFELSEQRAAEGRVSPGREFADSIAPNEFSEDMMFTPAELEGSAVPPQEISPFENQFDPRIAPGGKATGTADDAAGPPNDPKYKDPKFWKRHLDKAEDQFWTGERDVPTDSWGLDDIWTRNSDLPPADPQIPVGHRAFGFEGERPPAWQTQNQYPVDMFESRWADGLSDAKEMNIDTTGKYPDWIDLNRSIYDQELDMQRMTPEDAPRSVPDEDIGFDSPNLQPQFNESSRIHGETSQFEQPEWFNVDDDFGIANDDPFEGASSTFGKGKLVKKDGPVREKNFPSVIPEAFEKVGKGRQVGPKGASYRIKDPNGKHIGDINITPKEIAEFKAHDDGALAHLTDESVAGYMYQERLDDLLQEHGFSNNDIPRMGIEPKTTRTKDVQVPPDVTEPKVTKLAPAGEAQMMSAEPTYSEATPTPAKARTDKRQPKPEVVPKPPFDPNKAFGPNGDITPIEQEFARLQSTNADDAQYGKLLPDGLLGDVPGPGGFKQKVQDALRIVDELESSNARRNPEAETAGWNERQQLLADLRNKLKIGELDDFTNRVIEMSKLDPEPIHAPIDPSKVDVSKLRPGKLNQHSAKLWMSPKMQQQDNALYRKRMGLPPKPPKKPKK